MKGVFVLIFNAILGLLSACEGFTVSSDSPIIFRDTEDSNGIESGKAPEHEIHGLPSDCGNVRPTWREETSARETELFEFPFYADLIYENTTNSNEGNGSFHCGGTLISKKFVVTAASCIKAKPKVIAVRLGEYDLRTNPDCLRQIKHKPFCAPPYVEYNVTSKDIITHKLYTNDTSTWKESYDVALIKLPEEVTFNDAIESVCLPIKPNYRKQGNLTIVGFPRPDNSSARSDTLLIQAMPFVTNAQCEILLNKPVESSRLCAGGRNRKRYCEGYGGSALLYVVAEKYRLRWVLGAVVPYGMNVCDPNNIPKVFTKMETFNEWILENIKA